VYYEEITLETIVEFLKYNYVNEKQYGQDKFKGKGLASRCIWLSIIMLREKVILKITKCEIL
jgi:hypothetical protein